MVLNDNTVELAAFLLSYEYQFKQMACPFGAPMFAIIRDNTHIMTVLASPHGFLIYRGAVKMRFSNMRDFADRFKEEIKH